MLARRTAARASDPLDQRLWGSYLLRGFKNKNERDGLWTVEVRQGGAQFVNRGVKGVIVLMFQVDRAWPSAPQCYLTVRSERSDSGYLDVNSLNGFTRGRCVPRPGGIARR